MEWIRVNEALTLGIMCSSQGMAELQGLIQAASVILQRIAIGLF